MPNQSIFRNAAYLLIGGAFVAVRWIVESGLTPRMYVDSDEYIALAQRPTLDLSTLLSVRPAVILLFYRIVGATPNAVISFQWIFSTVAWLLLAAVVARALTTWPARLAGFVLVLTLGLSTPVIGWDSAVLSESPSLSMTAIFVASWLWLLGGVSWLRVAVVCLLGIVWAYTRDSNAAVLAMIALVLVAIVLWRRSHRAYFLPVSAIFLATSISVAMIMSGSPRRWVPNFHDVLLQRVLPDADFTDFYLAHGMPFPPAMKALSGPSLFTDPNASAAEKKRLREVRTDLLEKSPELGDFRKWRRTSGKQTESEFVLAHPMYQILGSIGDLKLLLAPPLDYYEGYRGPGMRPPLPRPLESIFFPDNLPGLGIATTILVLTFIALALRGGRVRLTPLTIVTVAILVLAYPATLSVWIGDSADYQRHNLTHSVFLRLGEILLFLVILETIALRFLPGAKAPAAKFGGHRSA